MKKLLTMALTGVFMLAVAFPAVAQHHGGSPSHSGSHSGYYGGGHGYYYGGHGYYGGNSHGGHSDWATVGQIMTGVFIGSALQSAYYYNEPPRREVVYAQPVYAPPVYSQPVYAPPVYSQPVYAPPVYSQPVYAPPAYAPPASAQPTYAPPASPPPEPAPQPTAVKPNPAKVILWVQNSNGSQTPVALQKAENGQYIGPKGEYYTGLPTNDQLRQLYGL